MMSKGMLVEHDQDGTHTNITATSITTDTLTINNATTTAGYNPLGAAPNTVTYNGNRSYDLVFNGTDYTDRLSPGMRLQTTRTVAAPTQCTSLDGTTQYYSKSSPAGMTFTDDFVVSAWVKLSSYPASTAMIASRHNGTAGWRLEMRSDGRVSLLGQATGTRAVISYQSLPLNKWVHVTAQLDMSANTVTSTTCYIMFDGTDIPAVMESIGGTPSALTQAGSLEIGSYNGGANLFPGKIAQAAVFNAKVTQATMRGYISQGLAGTETSLISAYSFNNSINDLNTSNANNLTANGSAVATNADSPFGTQASGLISSTLDYGIIQSVSFSTNTTVVVQVPEGCTIPTSGGVSAVSYSSNKVPYEFPAQRSKWAIESLYRASVSATAGGATNGTWYKTATVLPVYAGSWVLRSEYSAYADKANGDVWLSTSLSSSGTTETDPDMTASGRASSLGTTGLVEMPFSRSKNVTLSSLTEYSILVRPNTTGISNMLLVGGQACTKLIAENAYL